MRLSSIQHLLYSKPDDFKLSLYKAGGYLHMKILLAFILIISLTDVSAQKGTEYSFVSHIVSRIPDSLTYSTERIADYINAHFSSQKEKSLAIFTWIVKNIEYDFDSSLSVNLYQTPSEISAKVLKTRTGVCLHFASLFSEIANKTGIQSYIVHGYTKQRGVVDYISHVWCAGMVDSVWYLFDPTWGSGYLSHRRFIKQVNYYYFMTKPKDLIKSHMPFDPLWQFLNYPVTNQEFYNNVFWITKNKVFFNYIDTLDKYEHESEIERYISSARRIEQNGGINAFVAAKLRILKGDIEYYQSKMIAEKYSSAVNVYNKGIHKLNKFINISNNSFKSDKDTCELKQILDSAEYFFRISTGILNEIRNPDESMTASVMMLNHAINESMKILNDQKTALERYLRSRKQFNLIVPCISIIAVVQSCSRAVVQSCSRAVLQSCSHAVVQSCSRAVMQSCSRAVVQSCSHAVVQSCSRAVVQLCSRAVVQLCSRAVVQSCSRAVIQSCSHTVVQSCSLAVVQSCSCAVVQSCSHAVVQSYSHPSHPIFIT
jgi:hypothetical protein